MKTDAMAEMRALVAKYGITKLLLAAELGAWDMFEAAKDDTTIEGMQKAIGYAEAATKCEAARKLTK